LLTTHYNEDVDFYIGKDLTDEEIESIIDNHQEIFLTVKDVHEFDINTIAMLISGKIFVKSQITTEPTLESTKRTE
jgi:hypothetical protein